MDSREQVLRGKTMRLVKVLLQHQEVEEATWERKDTIVPIILSYLRMKVCFVFCHLILNDYSICM